MPVAGTTVDLGPTVDVAPGAQHTINDHFTIDLEAPSGAEELLVGADGINSLGADCWANLAGIH